MTASPSSPVCYLQVTGHMADGGLWTQEHYETASRDAGKRSRQLRKAGFVPIVSPGSYKVTRVGTVKMSMISVYYRNDQTLPAVKIVSL